MARISAKQKSIILRLLTGLAELRKEQREVLERRSRGKKGARNYHEESLPEEISVLDAQAAFAGSLFDCFSENALRALVEMP